MNYARSPEDVPLCSAHPRQMTERKSKVKKGRREEVSALKLSLPSLLLVIKKKKPICGQKIVIL